MESIRGKNLLIIVGAVGCLKENRSCLVKFIFSAHEITFSSNKKFEYSA